MSNQLVAVIERLLANDEMVPASAFTAGQRRVLDDFARRTNLVARMPKGSGVVYRVVARASLESHLQSLRPHAKSELPKALPQRAANLASRRDSKAASAAHALSYVLLKAVGDAVCWEAGEGRSLDLSQATRSAGAGALAIRNDDAWVSPDPLWLVENQALFDSTDWFPAQSSATLMYYAGQIPDRVIEWLAARPRAPQIILFADYDGVGLRNYARLLERCGSMCSFWLMPGWQALLSRYGSDTVWQATHPQFVSAVTRLEELNAPPEVLELCAAMSREGKALEHEAVWLSGLPADAQSGLPDET